jgi:uncharacterized membrane protein
MRSWVLTLFIIGLVGLIFNIFVGIVWFTPIWAVVLMVFSFNMLNQVYKKEKDAEKEKLEERIKELEALLKF